MREPQATLSPVQVDALRQLAGLGSTDAVRSLGHLLGTAVEGTKVRSHFASSASLVQVLGAEGPAFAAHFTVEGGARLRVLIYFTVEGATLMAGLLLGTPLSERSALYSSALAEACNILVSSYVGGVGPRVGLTQTPSIP